MALIPSDQPVQFVAERPISTEGSLVEQALDTATEADLVRVTLGTDRPAHLAVPAAAQNQYGSAGNSCRNQT